MPCSVCASCSMLDCGAVLTRVLVRTLSPVVFSPRMLNTNVPIIIRIISVKNRLFVSPLFMIFLVVLFI